MGLKILHLSDLHISSNEDSNYITLRKGILKYLQENQIKIDLVAFTGDIIDKNDVAAFSKAREFFQELLEISGLTSERLLIVPGNHDMERSEMLRNILDPEKIKTDEYLKANWKYIKVRMDAYSEFISSLGIGNEEIKDGYGVKEIQIEDMKICINLINSAWSSRGNDDYRNLVIGRWQLEENRQKIAQCTDKDLVITMLHHPLTWLTDDESEMMKDYLCHEDKFSSYILLHGHIHNSKTQRELSPSGGFTSLITGIGYPKSEEREAGQPKICECKFSIYDIDMERNCVDNFCLTSTAQGNFVPDTGLYKGSQDGHYIFPVGGTHEVKEKEHESEYKEVDPVPVINCWSGRSEELELISKDNTNVIAISGVGGQGKTALAAKFMRETPISAKKFDKKLWVDCRELPNTMHVKLLNLLEGITGGKERAIDYRDEQLSDTIKRFFGHISKERILIVFDNVDAYVNLESEELIGELNEFVDIALTRQHNSLLILTCRIPIYDSRANFRTIKLDGLKEPEGIEFFKNRGVSIQGEDDEIACKQIIRITKGHPWWLGLIAGQMISTKVSPKEYLDENRDGILARDSQVERFFGAIWEKLSTSTGSIAQNVIRYLSETIKPLSVQELSLLMLENYKNTNKAVKLLLGLNLLIVHGENETQNKSYQVHPLVREFIHKNYDQTVQKPYVDSLVKMMMGNNLYAIIFVNDPSVLADTKEHWNSRNIIDSIETCLTSRNDIDALTILSSTFDTIVNDGYHAEFLSLTERVLDNIDWKKEELGTNRKRAALLSQYLDLLGLQEQNEANIEFYLKKYESICERNTIPYSGFLATKAAVLWQCDKSREALIAFQEYEEISKKTSETWCFSDMKNLKGMILREVGDIDGALAVFEENTASSAKYGNIARCHLIQEQYDLALNNLKICVKILYERGRSFTDYVNIGYAYLWIAEVFLGLDEIDKAQKFLLLCQETWKEYAPGLLSKTNTLSEKLGKIKMSLNCLEIEKMVEEFIKDADDVVLTDKK